MHKIFPDFKTLVERNNSTYGEELRFIFMSMEMLISKLPIIPNKNQEDLWYRVILMLKQVMDIVM